MSEDLNLTGSRLLTDSVVLTPCELPREKPTTPLPWDVRTFSAPRLFRAFALEEVAARKSPLNSRESSPAREPERVRQIARNQMNGCGNR